MAHLTCMAHYACSLACIVIELALLDANAAARVFSQAPAPDGSIGNVQTALEELRQMAPQAIQQLKTNVQPFMKKAGLSDACSR